MVRRLGDAEHWQDIWLNEGFATYAEALWREQSDPVFDIDEEMNRTIERFGAHLGPIGDPGAGVPPCWPDTVVMRPGCWWCDGSCSPIRSVIGSRARS